MFFWVGWFLSRLTLMFFGRVKIVGAENVPKKGPVIIAPNHVSYIDPPAIGCGIRRKTCFMAKTELFDVPALGAMIRMVGSFPVKQNTADRTAIRKALDILAGGGVVCVFPEGTRSRDGNLRKALPGVGMIALKSKAPVVPVALIGTEKLLKPGSPLPRFTRVKILYGKPMAFDDLYGEGLGREAVDEVGRRIMSEISELMKRSV